MVEQETNKVQCNLNYFTRFGLKDNEHQIVHALKFNRIHSNSDYLFSFPSEWIYVSIILGDLLFDVIEDLVDFNEQLAENLEPSFVDCDQFLFIFEELLEECFDLVS
jgi:hypothetical protein